MDCYPYDPTMNFRRLWIEQGRKDHWTKTKLSLDMEQLVAQIEEDREFRKKTEDEKNRFYHTMVKWNCEARDRKNKSIKWLQGKGNTNSSKWFVTIGFDDDKFELSNFRKWINNFITLNWILECEIVFERHRSEGIHNHCHMMFIPDLDAKGKPRSKANIVQNIYKSAGIKKLINGENFIQVQPWEDDRHVCYLNGEKKEAKLPLVEADRLFREENNIPHKFQKCV